MGLIYAIILIGVLIFVHELGHFLVAKYFDVKVLRFAIGFGPTIVSYTRGETEYALCALPLGGYVQMLGGDLESIEHLPKEDRERALMSKPIWQRSLVVLAGPVFNIVLPVIIYFVFAMGVTTTIPSVVGDVFEGMPAASAGLKPGDKIVEIDGEPIGYWYEVIENLTTAPGREVKLKLERDGKIVETSVTPQTKTDTDFLGLNVRTYGLTGIHPATYGPTLGITNPEGPAAQAGLEHFDRVISIDGKHIRRFDQIESAIRSSNGTALKMQVFRRSPISVDFGRFYAQHPIEVTVTPTKVGDEWTIGVHNAEMFVSRIEDGSPSAKAGLQIGDMVTKLDGVPISNWRYLNRQISNAVNTKVVEVSEETGAQAPEVDVPFEITYVRDGKELTTTLTPKVVKLEQQDFFKLDIGWGHIPDLIEPDEVPFPFFKRLAYAAEYSVSQTWEFCKMLVLGFVRMAQGRLSLDNVGGPIMIGELAAQAGKAGWDRFLQMMALISINLGVINLLPIPILDGGQLMLFALEKLKRGPLSFRTRQIAAYVGFTMILFLVVLAFKNDIERQWDDIAQWVNEL